MSDEQKLALSPFEQQLAELFPEIFKLHLLALDQSKGGAGEVHIWTLVEAVIKMYEEASTGTVFVNYSQGRIDSIKKTVDVIAFKKNRPGY